MTYIASHVLMGIDAACCNLLGRISEVKNTPRISDSSNAGFFSGSQLNIAGAIQPNSTETLQSSLGQAGGAHFDKKDSRGALTAMIPFGDLPGCHPGFFFILDLGIYTFLDNFSVTCFSGLRLHGGSPPRPLAGQAWREYLTRLNWIGYPNDPISSHLAQYALAAAGRGKTLDFDERLLESPLSGESFRPLNFARDGFAVMTPAEHVKYVIRESFQLLAIIRRQMPSSYALEVDVPTFFSSFSFTNEGVRSVLPSWTLAPGQSSEVDRERNLILKEGEDRAFATALSMPSQLLSEEFDAYFRSLEVTSNGTTISNSGEGNREVTEHVSDSA